MRALTLVNPLTDVLLNWVTFPKPVGESQVQTDIPVHRDNIKNMSSILQHSTLILCKLDKMLLTMYKGPSAQYANYTDEGTDRAKWQPISEVLLPPKFLHPWPLGQSSTSLESEGISGLEGVATVTAAPDDRWDVWWRSAQQGKSRVTVYQPPPKKAIFSSWTWRWSFRGWRGSCWSSWFGSNTTQRYRIVWPHFVSVQMVDSHVFWQEQNVSISYFSNMLNLALILTP